MSQKSLTTNKSGFLDTFNINTKKSKKDPELKGDHITLKANQNITIECGKSSILLQKDGTVIIRGVKVISRASKSNKVRGATVKIN